MPEQIITVTGPIEAQQLGITDAHSHVWIDPVPGGDPTAPVLNDAAAILAELKEYQAAGGGAIIDCQPRDCGRDARKLRQLSVESGVSIVACTGFHRRRYYAPDNAPLWGMTAEAARDLLVNEIRHGLSETRGTSDVVYPGFIKIAAETAFADSPRHLFEAAASAAIETGYAIEMHTERGAAIEDCLAFFIKQGLSPSRLVFCHVDKRADFGLHREMASADVMLEYDTFYRPKYQPEENLWPLLAQMIEAGFAHRVALATDMAGGELWARLGNGPGLVAFFSHIQARLEANGVEPSIIKQLMGGNIAARLAIV